MKKVKSLLCSLFILIIAVLPACNAFAAGEKYYPYVINNYDVKIDVDEDNILHITETIDVNFNEARHGIYRTIPRRFAVEREDGSSSNAKIKVKHFQCSDDYDLSSTGDEYTIQIGDANRTITGSHTYVLSYDYIIGKDLLEGADEFYYNIIGTEWDTAIQNVTFEINMPKEFDSSKLGFSAGYKGEVGTEAVDYSVDGNRITGKMTMPLGSRMGLTARLELPKGYFQIDKSKENMSVAGLIILPCVLLIAVLVIWRIFGKDKKVIDVVEFYPPEGMNCVDVAYWYKGAVTGEDVVPLLIELANEGYLTINERDGSYIIKRVKSYDGDDQSKKTFMNGLFMHGDTTYKSRLEKDFYIYIDMIKESYNTSRNRRKVFVNHSLTMRIICWVFIIGFMFVNYMIFEDSYQTASCIYALIGGYVIYLCAFIISFFVRKRTDDGHRMLQMINGFKIFLETAEKEKLETLVEDDPQYFYNILPYTYVLGVSKKWVEKFEPIAMEPPVWCGTDYYGLGYIYFINSTFRDCIRSMQVRPVETGGSSGGHSLGSGSGVSGGGFSGGGMSGGGFGGGGGGSW